MTLISLFLAGCAPLETPAPAITAAPTAPPATRPALPTLPPTGTAAPTLTPVDTPASTLTTAPPAPNLSLSEIHMWDAARGWGLAAEAGRLVVTADGGRTWRDRTPPDPLAAQAGYMLSAAFLDPDQGWAVYVDTVYSGVPLALVVWRTRDGGQNWSAGAAPVPAAGGDWGELQFVSPDQGWLTLISPGMAVHNIAIYGSQDGGVSWELLGAPVDPAVGTMLEDACYKSRPTFVTADVGWLTGACENSGYLFFKRTEDGGRTWTRLDLPAPADAPDLLAGRCWGTDLAAPVFWGEAGRGVLILGCDAVTGAEPAAPARWLYTTNDGGAQWQAQRLPAPYGDLVWAGPNNGWFLGRATYAFDGRQQLYRTADGGQTWESLGEVDWWGRPVFVDAGQGWVAARTGAGQELLQTVDGGLTWDVVSPRLEP